MPCSSSYSRSSPLCAHQSRALWDYKYCLLPTGSLSWQTLMASSPQFKYKKYSPWLPLLRHYSDCVEVVFSLCFSNKCSFDMQQVCLAVIWGVGSWQEPRQKISVITPLWGIVGGWKSSHYCCPYFENLLIRSAKVCVHWILMQIKSLSITLGIPMF